MKLHHALMHLTANSPMKTVVINSEPYLERYYMGTDEQGVQTWLHRFLRNDSESHLHTHPWDAESMILCGGYIEQQVDCQAFYGPGDSNQIPKGKLHRILEVTPNTWTMMRVQPGRDKYWYFVETNEPGEVNMVTDAVVASPEDWYKTCKVRGEDE